MMTKQPRISRSSGSLAQTFLTQLLHFPIQLISELARDLGKLAHVYAHRAGQDQICQLRIAG